MCEYSQSYLHIVEVAPTHPDHAADLAGREPVFQLGRGSDLLLAEKFSGGGGNLVSESRRE